MSIAGLRVGVVLVLWGVVWWWFRISLWLVWRVVWFWLRWIVGLLLRWVVWFLRWVVRFLLRWVVWLRAWLWVLRVIRRLGIIWLRVGLRIWLRVGLRIWLRVGLVSRLRILLRIGLRVLLGVRLVYWLMVLGLGDWFSSRLWVWFRNRSRVDRGRVGWWGRGVVRWRWWTIRIRISSHDLVVASMLLELVHGDSILHPKHRLGVRQTKG